MGSPYSGLYIQYLKEATGQSGESHRQQSKLTTWKQFNQHSNIRGGGKGEKKKDVVAVEFWFPWKERERFKLLVSDAC